MHRDNKDLRFLAPKYHPKTSLIFTLSRQDWLAKKCLQFKPFQEVEMKLKKKFFGASLSEPTLVSSRYKVLLHRLARFRDYDRHRHAAMTAE